jgi:hypothetical protein
LDLVDSPIAALLAAPPSPRMRFYVRRKDLPEGARPAMVGRDSPRIIQVRVIEDTSTRVKIAGTAPPGSVVVLNEDPGAGDEIYAKATVRLPNGSTLNVGTNKVHGRWS